MKPFTSVTGVAAPLLRDDINTDEITPIQIARILKPDYAELLFMRARQRHDGSPDPDFVFNRPQFRRPAILVTGRNFGCGSSREHAVWALREYGFRAILAHSFADIFFANCCQNGLLPVRLLPQEVAELFRRHQAAGGEYQLTVDLEEQRVHDGLGFRTTFSMEPYRREMLLHGLDEIGRTLRFEDRIGAYEKGRA